MKRIPAIVLICSSAMSIAGCSTLRNAVKPFDDEEEQVVFIERDLQHPVERPEIPQQKAEVAGIRNEGLASERQSGTAAELLNYAKSKLGCKYKYAASGPDLFDCSGFTSYVFAHFGIKLSRSSAAQINDGVQLKKGDPLKPGDLVFWSGRAAGSAIGHVGIVVEPHKDGTFTFIHAASTGVQIDNSTMDYYAKRYKGACRVILD